MGETAAYDGQERRARARSERIELRRRTKRPIESELEQRRGNQNGFDIAAALELHLDEAPTRRAMIALLGSWLDEAKQSAPEQRDEGYVQAVEHAIEIMKASPDPLSAIVVLQRRQS